MADSSGSQTHLTRPSTGDPTPVAADQRVSELSLLLKQLQRATAGVEPATSDERADNQLVQVRLGIATSLFTALRCKHAPTAAHALRVALSSSLWCLKTELPQPRRDAIEIAALLHDVGVIGVPDQILLKPGALDRDETTVIERSREMSLEILRDACAEPAILQIVENVPAWYDGSRDGHQVSGKEIPLGARMIAVVEAFDAMTSDHVYRPAMSQERAVSELFRCAGTQFDPQLVSQFAELRQSDLSALRAEVSGRWFRSLDPEVVNSYWELNHTLLQTPKPNVDALFQAKLLENMHDAVVFIDDSLKVMLWNRGAERLTGIAGSSVCQRRWQPNLLNMRDEKGVPVIQMECPVTWAISSGVQSLRRLTIWDRAKRPVSVDAHAIPVFGDDGTAVGAIMLLHDASPEASLEERCQNLHEKATKDPLTQVANRAEFDRVHKRFIEAHRERRLPCSLIICDLDHFKQVNDTYGHQAGDDVIKCVAAILRSCCRPGDLVARYGGEEFVVLCADCDNATTVQRAEQIRKALSQISQSKMAGRCVTASFGVTEIQPGDTPETMLRRSDRALLMAKTNGRNTVVQLGTGPDVDEGKSKKGFWKRRQARPEMVLEQDLITPVPVRMAVEKLRGFVADHCAKIVEIAGDNLRLEIDGNFHGKARRRGDRSVTFCVDLRLEEERLTTSKSETSGERGVARTRIHVAIAPKRNRDRRRDDVLNRAREVMVSFRSYLMATAEDPLPTKGVLRKARRIITPWLARNDGGRGES